jgi:hypothetical protein
MAIIQISKIQQRSGDLVDLPQLDEAEFGFASDEKRLFIGKTEGSVENIEVLTSYSEIAFSQLQGAVGNLDINTDVQNGQVLVYDGNNWVNRGGDIGGYINFGEVANVKILGGTSGYVLQTDGTGNLSWAAGGGGGGGGGTPGGANTQIQFNNAGSFGGSSGLTYNVANSTLSVTGNIVAGNIKSDNFYYSNGVAISFGYSNTNVASYLPTYAGTVGTGAANFVGTNTTLSGNANVTGNIAGGNLSTSGRLTVSGISNLGAVGNITITGGSSGYYLQTNGSGGLSWASIPSGNGIANGTSNITIPAVNGNVVVYSAGNNTANITGTGVNVAGTLSATGNLSGGNISTTGALTVLGTTNLGAVGNITITGGSSGYYLQTNGSGGLSWAAVASGNGIANGTSNITIPALNGNVVVYAAGNNTANITGTGANITGTLNVTGNTTVGNLIGSHANGTSNVNIPISSGNIAMSVGGTSNVLVVTSTGANIAGTLNTTGNANVFGNLGTSGSLTVAGNAGVTGNISTTGTLSVTGNANVGNLGTSGLVIATGNVTGGNLVTSGALSVTGNANVGNLGTSGLVIATGNVTGGNLVTSGALSVTGNANVGNLGTSGNVITGGIKTDNYYYANGVALTTGVNTVVFTSSGTWTVPAGVTKALVTVYGAGGNGVTWYYSGTEHFQSGGAGGYGTAMVTGLSGTIAITIAAAGSVGTTSFGTMISATGGGTGTGSPGTTTGVSGTNGTCTVSSGTAIVLGTCGTNIDSLIGSAANLSTPTSLYYQIMCTNVGLLGAGGYGRPAIDTYPAGSGAVVIQY